MIGRLAAQLDQRDVPAGVGGGVAQHLQELLGAEVVGAGGGGDDGTRAASRKARRLISL